METQIREQIKLLKLLIEKLGRVENDLKEAKDEPQGVKQDNKRLYEALSRAVEGPEIPHCISEYTGP